MRAVVQRVSHASVTVGGEVVGRIESGLLVLLGVAEGDTVVDGPCRTLARELQDGQKVSGPKKDEKGEWLFPSKAATEVAAAKDASTRAVFR